MGREYGKDGVGLTACRPTLSLDAFVVEWIETDVCLLGRERVLAVGGRLEFVVGSKIRPAPEATVDDVGKFFSIPQLNTTVDGARKGNTLRAGQTL